MTLTPAQIAIAKLIELAETGEIDPWDVQVIEVIDRFLNTFPANQADLAESGQAFLWASMLVLLKANTLSDESESESESESSGDELMEEAEVNQRSPIFLEKHLRRRTAAPPQRRRRVTLQELIAQIREIEAKLVEKPKTKRPRPSRTANAQAIAQLAHQENLTEVAGYLEIFLRPYESQLKLEELLELLMASPNPVIPRKDKVGVFWALLLLSSESKVELSQSEFYQDLTITPLFSIDEALTG